ncbi:nitrophenyl compound nitroreductase subunit ArsF family protein [Lutibacter holmesii]|uniref:Nitrophenyl compound nitroreductase subunit ArsF family protein n=1 Tax=Lutibacter holmesii TaxID=1137985 RepID=A0ABW3WLZ6_9FLAO
MKKLSLIVLVVGVLFSCKEKTQKNEIEVEKLVNQIEVIDFHSTHRCMTCNAIEANTKYTLDTYFSSEVAAKKITFQAINVDEEMNLKIAEKFEATGTALFLNVIVDGKETQIDLTEFAFMSGNNQEEFSNELKSKLEVELAKI